MLYIKYICSLLIAFCFLACTTKVTLPIPVEINRPVISVLMNKDSVIYVTVALTTRLVKKDTLVSPNEVLVELFENGQFKERLTRKKFGDTFFYYYVGTSKVKQGNTYKVTAAIPGYEIAEGTDIVPDTVEIGEMKRMETTTGNLKKTKMSVQLNDKGGERNYYRIRLYQGFEVKQPDSSVIIVKGAGIQFEAERNALEGIFDEPVTEVFYTDDKSFDGKRSRFDFYFGQYITYPTMKYIVVEVATLTAASYQYLQTSHIAALRASDALAEKVLVYSNVKNGVGIVGGMAVRTYVVVK